MGGRAKKPKIASFAHQTALAHPCGSAHSVQPTALVQMDLPELDTVLLGENKKKIGKFMLILLCFSVGPASESLSRRAQF